MRSLATLIFWLIAFTAPSYAVQHYQKSNQTPRTDQVLLAIRQDALAAVDEVVDEMTYIEDLRSRVALAEKIVRLLSKTRPDRCRKMLSSIFEEATALKANSKEETTSADLDSLISRIIQAAAVVDLELAQRLIKALPSSKQADPQAKQDASSAASLYLRIASDLIQANPTLAVTIANRSLASGINSDTLIFLAMLRKRDLVLANRFFLTATQSCKDRGAKDINQLLLLYSYVFLGPNPPVVLSKGIGTLSIPSLSDLTKDYNVDPILAGQYLKAVADVLFDPNRYASSNSNALVHGAEGDFFLATVVEPMARKYLPEIASALSSHRDTLLSYVQADRRDATFKSAERWQETPKNLSPSSGTNSSSLEYLVKKAESAPDTKRRDQLYFRAALVAVELEKIENAFNLIDKISLDNAKNAKQFLRFDVALHYVRTGRPFEAGKLARLDDVLERRAYILTLIADYFVTQRIRDTPQGIQYLEEVQRMASTMPDNQEKLAVLIGAGCVYAKFDTVRASEILREAIKLSNKLPDFTGESTISNVLEISGFFFDYSIYDNGFTILDILGRLAPTSYYSTLQDVRSLKNRLFRLTATVALCAAVNNNKPLASIVD